MKLSKSLLQAIVVGVSLGTAATSCDLVESNVIPEIKKEKPTDEGTSTRQTDNQGGTCEQPGGNDWENCPACGMG